jgi:hypothetical protein
MYYCFGGWAGKGCMHELSFCADGLQGDSVACFFFVDGILELTPPPAAAAACCRGVTFQTTSVRRKREQWGLCWVAFVSVSFVQQVSFTRVCCRCLVVGGVCMLSVSLPRGRSLLNVGALRSGMRCRVGVMLPRAWPRIVCQLCMSHIVPVECVCCSPCVLLAGVLI